jgi:hypothetical protein
VRLGRGRSRRRISVPKRVDALVGCFVFLLLPSGKDSEGVVAEHLRHRNTPRRRSYSQFVVNESVIEAGAGRISGRGCIEDPPRASPIDCAETHGTRLTRGVEIAAGELKIGEGTAGISNGNDFGMRGGIVGASDAVRAFSDDSAILDNDRSERATASRPDIFQGQRDSALHEIGGHETGSIVIQIVLSDLKAQRTIFPMRGIT